MTALDTLHPARPTLWGRLSGGHAVPVLTVLLAVLALWYAAAVWMNAPQIRDEAARNNVELSTAELVGRAYAMERPVLPAPHQIASELWRTTVAMAPTSKRSLVYHAWVTVSATLAGFAIGAVLGVVLAVGIVHSRVLDRSLMPWIIASQTIPILAIAPMIVVVLGNIGFTGVLPKAVISAYLSFFPITIGMVKGLRSPDPIQRELLHTYNATESQAFFKLRWPASVSFLFPSFKVAIALSLVGAIVGELPTGAAAGIGARLLSGSYYGQTVQIWSALFMAAFLAMLAIALVALAERAVALGRGGRL
ncbi:MAG TPA: ABC transporter permease [Alphaproteobacteria bacterium]|nr:ABC transporter permease [Alphaproteobacteria bacterium]